MIPRNAGKNKDEILKNRFTSYLTTAVQHRRIDYMQEQADRQVVSQLMDEVYYPESFDLEKEALKDLPILVKMENEALLNILMELDERELYVLLKRTLDDTSLEDLAEKLGLSYKGAAAVYYRVKKKIKDKLRGGKE